MSEIEVGAGRETEQGKPAVRLRRPERGQMTMVVQCRDDWVSAVHPVRMVAAVVAKLDVTGFCEPIKAREGTSFDWDLLWDVRTQRLWFIGIMGVGGHPDLRFAE